MTARTSRDASSGTQHVCVCVQMTAAQEESWASDANQYVAEEDIDAFGARSSCEMLLTELQARCTPLCALGTPGSVGPCWLGTGPYCVRLCCMRLHIEGAAGEP